MACCSVDCLSLEAVINSDDDDRLSLCGWPWVNGPLFFSCLVRVLCVCCCLFFYHYSSKWNPHLFSNQGLMPRRLEVIFRDRKVHINVQFSLISWGWVLCGMMIDCAKKNKAWYSISKCDDGGPVSCCNARSAPATVPQTFHNWVSEELIGRSSTAALLSTEGNQEERCKQVEPAPAANHNTTSTHCPVLPAPVPNHQPSGLWKPLTHLYHLCSSCSAITI